MEFDFTEEKSQALFNAGIAKLQRIDFLKKKMHQARENSNYETWYNCLCGWAEEMSERMSEEQEEMCNKYEENVEKLLGLKRGEHCVPLFKKYARYLSKCEYEFGLSMPDKESGMNALK